MASSVTTVPYDDLVAAMSLCRGYNILATTNAARFHAEVLLRLARQARERDPEGGPLFIRQEDWFQALLKVSGIGEEGAPTFASLAKKNGQDFLVEYRENHVIRQVVRGPTPSLALDVNYSWALRPNKATEYSYEDSLSTPRLKVTNKPVITYRLLDFGDRIVFDEIQGLFGRPTSGALGLLFQIIGEGRVVEFRMAAAPDGTMVARARSRKAFIEIGTTVTVRPDGKSDKGVPPDPVLRALERRVEAPFDIRYQPLPSMEMSPQ
jgi:hypothetical protein